MPTGPATPGGGALPCAPPHRRARLLAVLLGSTLLVGGCGDDRRQLRDPGVHRQTIVLIARGDDGRKGEPVGCGDSAVPVTVMVPPGTEPLPGALRTLLELDRDSLAGPELLNPLFHSDLRLGSWSLDDGRAEVYLEGELRPSPWPCNALRVRAQLVGTVQAVEGIEEAAIFIDGVPLDRHLERLAPAPGQPRTFRDTAPGRRGP